MTKREVQKRLVDLSVITVSALALGGAYLLAARVDAERDSKMANKPKVELRAPIVAAQTPAPVAKTPPVAGLIPAPLPRRRVVVVRRSRAS